jgi:hypothetical protein
MNRRAACQLLLLAAVAALSLAACATPRQKPTPVVVVTPPPVTIAPEPGPAAPVRKVPASCVPRSLPGPPAYPDTDTRLRSAGEAAERYQLLAAGRLVRMRRLAELERVIEACRRPG